jgi:hypothetical protein
MGTRTLADFLLLKLPKQACYTEDAINAFINLRTTNAMAHGTAKAGKPK